MNIYISITDAKGVSHSTVSLDISQRKADNLRQALSLIPGLLSVGVGCSIVATKAFDPVWEIEIAPAKKRS